MTDGPRLVAGLGNPGAGYQATRHNAGFWLVDALAARNGGSWSTQARFQGAVARITIGSQDVWLLKPDTFMNRSGQAIRALADFYKLPPEAILVAHDDLDLPPGTVRLKRAGGHGGHNGLRNIHQHLGSAEYLRLRVGIGHPGHRDGVLNYVLGKPSAADAQAIAAAVDRAAEATELLMRDGWDRACQLLHSPPTS